MSDSDVYHPGMRELQDRRDTRRIADRLAEVTLRRQFTDEDRAFIEGSRMFFLATAATDGSPDCSYKGGRPGFVRVTDAATLEIPDYDGNGMYRSWGNVRVNPRVALLFIDFETPRRLRVNGSAEILDDPALCAAHPGAVFMVRVRAQEIFPNCPRYIHRMQLVEESAYAPRASYTPPVPAWKGYEVFRDALPERDRQP
jgi:predicted pyridoxine 5'-phosphate oxidase superfamily flavin-nucleotide-binding protein